jgi:cytidylate kinase
MKRFKINKEEAREQVKSQDRDRKKLIKVFFNRDIDDPLLYDMVWNTAKVELDVITRATLELINKRTEPREVKPLYR